MALPEQFQKENSENIFIYHYVEEMIANYGKFIRDLLDETEITRAEIPFLIRVRFSQKTTHQIHTSLLNGFHHHHRQEVQP